MDFEQLYQEQFPIVYRYLAALCGSASLAEELTQETFYRAVEHSASFRGECKLSVWLCQIGKNCWLSHLRKEKGRGKEGDWRETASPQNLEEEFCARERSLQIHKALHNLPEPYREVFTLRLFAELSFAQIGELFAKSETWARVTYHRAKLKLKERML
ncbi:sigma-70 family RNA polymerase sigma factor [Oscillospiraceae bacterium 50-16]|nr:sigma-70 family RNA polymerase sigma factor [Lawsonibacter sp.]